LGAWRTASFWLTCLATAGVAVTAPFWVTLAVVAMIVFYRFLRANFDEIERLRRQIPDAKRLKLKEAVGELLREGRMTAPPHYDVWRAKAYSLLERSLGGAEAQWFDAYDYTLNLGKGGFPRYREHASRIHRLTVLIPRMDLINILPSYSGEE
jgi:hypothetical protein